MTRYPTGSGRLRRRSTRAGLLAAVTGLGLLASCTSGTSAGTAGSTSSSSATVASSAAAPTSSVASTPSTPSSTGASSSDTPTTAVTTATTGTSATGEDKGAALDQALAELVAMPGGVPGVIAVVQVGNDRTVHTAGYADVKTKTKPTVNDHLRVASVAKAFSGATALALVQAGKLSLDDTVGRRLPSAPKAFAKVTLRQLLSHTSGVPDILKSKKFVERYVADPAKPPSPAGLVALVGDQPLDFPSGTRYVYSNTDNILVGLMIEAVTHQTYAQALSSIVATPLKLTNTSLPTSLALGTPTMHGYEWEPPATVTDVTDGLAPGWAWASGGVVSTPAELNTFVRAYVGGALFGAKVRGEQQRLFIPGGESGPPGPGDNSASLALFRYQTTCGTVYGHTGNTVGYTQFIAASPDGSRSVTVSINLQVNEQSKDQAAFVFHALQRAELAAVCVAMDGS